MPLNMFTTHRPSARAYYGRKTTHSYGWHRSIDVVPMSVKFHRWTLGFRQSSFDLIAQALQGSLAYTPSAVPCFSDMLLSPPPFRFRLVVRLGIIYPELRPPPVAIHSVRDTAHSFDLNQLSSDQF